MFHLSHPISVYSRLAPSLTFTFKVAFVKKNTRHLSDFKAFEFRNFWKAQVSVNTEEHSIVVELSNYDISSTVGLV